MSKKQNQSSLSIETSSSNQNTKSVDQRLQKTESESDEFDECDWEVYTILMRYEEYKKKKNPS